MNEIAVVGINQNQFAQKAGIGWHQVQGLVVQGIIKPVARVGAQLIFSPDDVDKAKAAIEQSKESTESAFRPEWEKLTAKQKAEFGTIGAFVGFNKNESKVQSHQGGRSWRAKF